MTAPLASRAAPDLAEIADAASRAFVDAFWRRVDRHDEHWIWRGRRQRGCLIFQRHDARTLALRLTGFPVDETRALEPTCSEPLCIRPDHQRPTPRKTKRTKHDQVTE